MEKKIKLLSIDDAPELSKGLLESINKGMGTVPNIFAIMAHSPAALDAFLTFKNKLSRGKFSSNEQEAISLAISQVNQCGYCLAAHTMISKSQGVSDQEILKNRKAESLDPKIESLVKLSKNIVETNGNPSEAIINEFFSAGYNEASLVELIGFVAVNIFTNYFNHIVKTPIDFPEVENITS